MKRALGKRCTTSVHDHSFSDYIVYGFQTPESESKIKCPNALVFILSGAFYKENAMGKRCTDPVSCSCSVLTVQSVYPGHISGLLSSVTGSYNGGAHCAMSVLLVARLNDFERFESLAESLSLIVFKRVCVCQSLREACRRNLHHGRSSSSCPD